MRCSDISLYFVRFSVGVSVSLECCVFDSVCDLFDETFRNVFAILLLNFMDVLSVDGGALLDRPCMVMVFQIMCVLCL